MSFMEPALDLPKDSCQDAPSEPFHGGGQHLIRAKGHSKRTIARPPNSSSRAAIAKAAP